MPWRLEAVRYMRVGIAACHLCIGILAILVVLDVVHADAAGLAGLIAANGFLSAGGRSATLYNEGNGNG